MSRRVMPPLRPSWLIVDGYPLFHRTGPVEPSAGTAIVHLHGFGISGSYLEPTASILAHRFATFVPDLPGSGRSHRHERPLDIPEMARLIVTYLDAVGLERAHFVGNSLGCVLLVELAAHHPERVDHVVLVSPAGGPNNQPMGRALRQMTMDAPREPPSLWPIAVADYLTYGIPRSWALFKAMTAYPTLERLRSLHAPTLVVGGERDPLVDFERASVFAGLPHVDIVRIPGAHALNFSRPVPIAGLIEAHVSGDDVAAVDGAEIITVPDR